MKKILYVTTVSRTINAFLVPHIEAFLDKGYVVDVACNFDKKLDEKLVQKGIKAYDIPFSRNPIATNNIKAFKKLLKIQKENGYDIVHVHTPIASIYGRLLKLKFKNLKTIYTAHGYHFLKGGSKAGWILYYPIEKAMAKLTDITININQEDFEITKNKLKSKKCYLVNGVGLDLNKYKKLSELEIKEKRKEIGFTENDFVIIMIAELNSNKNQIQLIKAMEVLKDKYPDIKAICVGEGNKLGELEEELKNRKLQNNIKFLGFRSDINELINISDIGTLLSYREGLPRSIMEILANGKPVIGTDIRGIRDLLENEQAGKLVNVGDNQTLAKYIEEYYQKVKMNQSIEVPKDIINNFEVENITKKIIKIVKGKYIG